MTTAVGRVVTGVVGFKSCLNPRSILLIGRIIYPNSLEQNISMARKIIYLDEEAKDKLYNSVKLEAFFEYQILWMLLHNDYCTWEDFRTQSKENKFDGILKDILEENMNPLVRMSYVKKETDKYTITRKGKKRIKLLETGKGYKRLQ